MSLWTAVRILREPRLRRGWRAAFVFLAVASLAPAGAGDADPRTMSVQLLPRSGEAVTIGTVTLEPEGNGYRYRLVLDSPRFEPAFLSMRPFRCLEGPEEMICHLPYPYANERRIRSDDLTSLEYDLLFIRRSKGEYGINPWNGLYYRLRWHGNAIEGQLKETDLDRLAAPPEPGVTRPIGPDDLHDADPDSHWLPRLLIQ